MVDDVGRGGHDRAQGGFIALKIGNEHLDAACGQGASDSGDGAGEMIRAAVFQIVPRDRGYDDVPEAEGLGRLGHALRFVRAGRCGLARMDVAEAAVARTRFAQDQKGGRARRVTLLPVGAVGRLAHGEEAQVVHKAGGGEKALVRGQGAAQPGGHAQGFLRGVAAGGGGGGFAVHFSVLWSILLLKHSLFQRVILAKNVVCASRAISSGSR